MFENVIYAVQIVLLTLIAIRVVKDSRRVDELEARINKLSAPPVFSVRWGEDGPDVDVDWNTR